MTENQENKTVDSSVSADEKSVKFDGSLLDLIQDADVEWKSLGDTLLSVPKINWSQATGKSYRYIDLSSVDRQANKITDTTEIDKSNHPSRAQQIIKKNDILFGTTRPTLKRYVSVGKEFDGQIASTGFSVLRPNVDMILPRYLYHIITSVDFQNYVEKNQKGASYPAISDGEVKSYKIPIPSLEIQQKVVEILDKMTDYVTELTAELTLRQKQYAYYRDQLLTFDVEGNPLSDSEESLSVRWTTLGEIADIGTGSSNTNEQLEIGKYPFYVRSQEVRFKDGYEFDEVATLTSGDGVGVGKIYHFVQGKYALHQRAYRIHITNSQVDDKYFFYFFQNWFTKYIEMQAVNSSVTSVRKPMLEKFQVAIPNLVEQKRIVKMLDKFDKLTSDLSEGLPREIELRQKQYEYWREQLLSFK